MTRSPGIATGLALALILGGCGSSPVARFYTLDNPNAAKAAAVIRQAAYVVQVGPVTVPDMVDRPQIVLRISDNQLVIAEHARWLEPLKSAIPRAIAGHLQHSLKDARVMTYPQSAGGDADYRVLMDVQRFDSALGDAATVEIQWSVRSGKGGDQKYGHSLVREATRGAGYDALVAAHARALAAVSLEIAQAIQKEGR